MSYYSIPVQFQGKYYKIVSCLGLLIEKERNCKSKQISKKRDLLDCVNNPFLLKSTELEIEKRDYNIFIRFYAKSLVWLCKHCYPIAYLLSHLRLNLFKNGAQASIAFRRIIKDKPQKVLCLPRAMFIASTSARFKEKGAMFIGVFLPTRRMHAWVIEDGRHTDYFDNEWICYKPVCMMA